MNSHARAVIARFVSKPNMMSLYYRITRTFNENPKVHVFLRQHFANLVSHFARTIEQEMGLSDMMAGTTYATMIYAYNERFMRDRCTFIQSHVLGDESAPAFVVTDGLPTSRFGAAHHAKSADQILQTWNMNATRGVQAREDQHGNHAGGYPRNAVSGLRASGANGANASGAGISARLYDPASAQHYNPHDGRGDDHVSTGIEFCDQSALNTSQHVSQLLDNSAIVSLNRETGHTNDAFGNATSASDARLLSRRIFRTNERGVENGVRMGDVRLHRRNLDRDIDEALPGAERDGAMGRGYDMTSLYDRVDFKQAARAAYDPTCANRYPGSYIYNAHTRVDTPRRC